MPAFAIISDLKLHISKMKCYICGVTFLNFMIMDELKTEFKQLNNTQNFCSWRILSQPSRLLIARNYTILAFVPLMSYRTNEEALQTANLIKAAPKMHQALKDLKSQLVDGGAEKNSVLIAGIDSVLNEIKY